MLAAPSAPASLSSFPSSYHSLHCLSSSLTLLSPQAIDALLRCGICQEFLNIPVMLRNCGHNCKRSNKASSTGKAFWRRRNGLSVNLLTTDALLNPPTHTPTHTHTHTHTRSLLRVHSPPSRCAKATGRQKLKLPDLQHSTLAHAASARPVPAQCPPQCPTVEAAQK